MPSFGQEFLESALGIGALKLLPKGERSDNDRESPYYYDSGLYFTGRYLSELSLAYAQKISSVMDLKKIPKLVLYGPASKGTILAPAVAMQLHQLGHEVSFASNQKGVRANGKAGTLIGSSLEEAEVVIIDDVITNGETKAEAVEFVNAHGGRVIAIMIAFDRQERFKDTAKSAVQLFQQKYGVPVLALANSQDLIALLEQDTNFAGNSQAILAKVKVYYHEYGV